VQKRIGELRETWKAQGETWPALVHRLRTRIGLNTGVCMIGNMGSRTRFNYTMMGDNVNLAARMESGAKSWGVYTMCTETTRLACEAKAPGLVVFRPLGRIVVKGRSQPVPINEIMGFKEELPASTFECMELFAKGLDRMYQRDWDGSLEYFRRSAELEPLKPGQDPGVASNASLVRIEKVEYYRHAEPVPDWDGVEVMTEK
jgi:adenylate cyclase